MILKKLNKFFKLSFVYLIFFLIGDVIVSNFFINTKIENNCYKWLDNFHHLKKNCYAKEKWINAGEGDLIYQWVKNPSELYNSGDSKMAKAIWNYS